MTSNMCMYPPKVYELTKPSNHRTSRITKIVQSMEVTSLVLLTTHNRYFDTSLE
jgi:hypothetical protein